MDADNVNSSGPHPHRKSPLWLRALGRGEPPLTLEVGGNRYTFQRGFKHDFFAATSLYQGDAGKVVLKIGRTAGLFGLPMTWVGRRLMRHEANLFELAKGIEGIPRCLGTWGKTGIVHDYVEGRPLTKGDQVEDEFFPRLWKLLDELHARDIAYVDLEKRENVIRGDDEQPYLIDFQISWHLPANRGGSTWPARKLLSILQASDRYHLLKHWRRMRPDQLDDKMLDASYRAPFWIAWHRTLFRPVTHFRRWILVGLGARSTARGRSPG